MTDSLKSDYSLTEIQWRVRPAESLLPELAAKLPALQGSQPFDISFTDVLGIPIYLTLRLPKLDRVPFPDLMEWGKMDFVLTHQGKGLTPSQSQVSCLMETMERYSAGCFPPPENLTRAAFKNLGTTALDPARFYLPPGIPYSPDKKLTWLSGKDLISGQDVLCPTDLALIDLPDSAYPFEGFNTERLGFFLTNGLSAGSGVKEAMASGICEVIERDAQYRIAQGLGPVPTELYLAGDTYGAGWARLFEEKGLILRAFVLSQFSGFYTIIAASWDPYCRLLVIGSAGARSVKFGLQQAVLEVAQQRAFMFFKRWKTRRKHFPIVRYIEERVRPDEYKSFIPPDFWTERCQGPIPLSEAGEDLSWDLDSVLADLPPDHQAVAVDLTRPETGIPVVRVIITGLKNGYLDWQTGLGFLRES